MTIPVSTPDFSSLARLLKPGQLLTRPVELLTYEIDAALDRGRPDGVVFPHTTAEVICILEWAAEHKIPVVARGAGTGLSGGAVAEKGGLIIEFSHMNHLLELDVSGRSVVFEPGLVNLKLDETVKKSGLYYPPDPASGRSSTLGGNIAENAGGPHCFKYGVTTNYLTGMEIVLAGGQAVRLGGRALDYPEFDLLGVMTGSEGTLGIVTQASARLLRNPPAVQTMMAAFDTVEEAGEAVSAVIACGLVPATMEMMDQKIMEAIEAYTHAGLPVKASAALIIEVDGFAESLAPQMEEIVSLLRQYHAWDLRIAQTAEERERIWYGRKSAGGAMARLSPSYYLLDGTVPRSKLASTLGAINQICERLGLRVGYVFHAGDGNLHPFVLITNPKDPELLNRVFQAGQEIMEICVAQEGSITGEHGVGIEKRKYMRLMYSPDELQAMMDIKAVFDPHHLLNPGKIFPEVDNSSALDQPTSGVVAPGMMAPRMMASVQGLNTPPSISPFVPETPAQAAEAIQAWAELEVPLRLRGGGTKSHLLPPVEQVLSTAALRGLINFALSDLYVTVAAGTPLAELQAELGQRGMWVPMASPWEAATVGGIIAANFNAPLRMRYGGLRDLLLAASVILPDGRTIKAGRPVVKNVAGYDLPKLFAGSYGTLGLITDVTLKLAPLPRARLSLLVPVPDLVQGLDWGQKLRAVCLNASSLLLCKGCQGLTEAPYSLIYSAEGQPEDVKAELAQARQVLQAAGATSVMQVEAPTGSQAWADWIRAGVQEPQDGGLGVSLVRLGVAPKDLPALLDNLAPALHAVSYYADLAGGLLYVQGLHDLTLPRQAALQGGGYAWLLAAPAGHLRDADPWGYAPDSLGLMKAIKACWDPQGRFNPGAFLV